MSLAPIVPIARTDSAVDPRQRYFAVPVPILVGLPRLACDVFIQHASAPRKVLYRSGSSDLPLADPEGLRQRNVLHLYLRVEDRERFNAAIRDTLAGPPADPAMHLALTVEQHRETFQVALQSRGAAPVVAAAERVAGEVLQVIERDDFSVGKVVSLLDHDHCTFQHSCNVSVYAATLGRRCGVAEDELSLLATGGLLHDIGKRHIPAFILRKPGKLDDREREIIRQHPTTGFRELAALKRLTWPQLMMVYQHHEWISGAGYPAGVVGDEIHLWARICAIADVFDALTANRPYRDTGPAAQAMAIMTGDKGHFDAALFDLWTEIVGS